MMLRIYAIAFTLLGCAEAHASTLFAVDWGNDTLYALDPTDGSPIRTYQGVAPLDANSMAADSDGTLLIAGGSSGLYRYDPRTEATSEPVPYVGLTAPSIRALTVSDSGRIFAITSSFELLQSSLIEINVLTGLVTEIVAVPYGIQGLATGPDGLLYGWRTTTRTLHMFTESGLLVSEVSFADGTNESTNIQSIEFIGDRLVAHRFDTQPLGATFEELDLASGTLVQLGVGDPLYSVRGLAYSSIPESRTALLMGTAFIVLVFRRSLGDRLPT